MISNTFRKLYLPLAVAATLGISASAGAAVFVQCPGDTNGDGVPESPQPNTYCKHLTAGDGFVTMADGRQMYIFSFTDVTGTPPDQVALDLARANFNAPPLDLKEGDNFYLTLTNVGMVARPDLFDAHSVHFHGFNQQAPVFDGVPEPSFTPNMGSSFTYFYHLWEPGTYMYHCHFEATEHIEMGMQGSLFVRPRQDGTPKIYKGKTYTKFVYNDGDGSTGYDKEATLQLTAFDTATHEADYNIQPIPFNEIKTVYPMINGRGYPDTVNPAALAPTQNPDYTPDTTYQSQKNSALIGGGATADKKVVQGDRLLLRLSNLGVVDYYTVTALGLPMKVVGGGARQLRGPTGKDISYDTGSVTLGGGESVEVMIDTANVQPGTYFLYTTNLNFLSNNQEDNGGMMTEIVISAPGA
ncbi:MAG: multicopper oxidase domain-containing protein [Gallionellaceae bacterium]|nr:multicopper oxidase domain-containing protein [Gallionellaceae bacterium]